MINEALIGSETTGSSNKIGVPTIWDLTEDECSVARGGISTVATTEIIAGLCAFIGGVITSVIISRRHSDRTSAEFYVPISLAQEAVFLGISTTVAGIVVAEKKR